MFLVYSNIGIDWQENFSKKSRKLRYFLNHLWCPQLIFFYYWAKKILSFLRISVKTLQNYKVNFPHKFCQKWEVKKYQGRVVSAWAANKGFFPLLTSLSTKIFFSSFMSFYLCIFFDSSLSKNFIRLRTNSRIKARDEPLKTGKLSGKDLRLKSFKEDENTQTSTKQHANLHRSLIQLHQTFFNQYLAIQFQYHG